MLNVLNIGGAPGLTPIKLPIETITRMSWFDTFMSYPPIRSMVPVPLIIAIIPVVWLFFRSTWSDLDLEAADYRARLARANRFDTRPLVCLLIVAISLTVQEYYGGRKLYDTVIRPWLQQLEAGGWRRIHLAQFDDFYGYAWWVISRILGYVVFPFPIWKILYPRDSLLDLGLRIRGFSRHIWIYVMCLAVVVPAMLVVANQPDFGTYYPFYKLSSRSWYDLILWESIYFVQFFALELFFRGFVVGTLRRSLGATAIFAMAVPYCMIHYGKPYLEAHGAIVAGVVLGSLSAKTRSIYAGFLVHITVALSMDFLALWHRHALPTVFMPAFGGP
jgi:membrane protease YdiL (CAAX protease family)